ncbi:hypothetical protein AVEN_11360-1 [Araneus ventricosus]|uniref:Uncharacterized protein n=1 Tax=Araneus ventricosus TaxID=182803 RepID=A0A4Y2HC87_ARAVE|nr:hypothetical protein AVEN_11360-1 [Araneus ventricosus]
MTLDNIAVFPFRCLREFVSGRFLWENFRARGDLTVFMDCGRWNSKMSHRSYGAWLCKYLCSARVNGCTDAAWPLPTPLTCELFTAITRETTDALTSPRATYIFTDPTMVWIEVGVHWLSVSRDTESQ